MSIRIDKEKCRRCKGCLTVCPGNLLDTDQKGYARISKPEHCWGCTGCMKVCPYGAITLTLNGNETGLQAIDEGEVITWSIVRRGSSTNQIVTLKSDANKY